MPWLTGTVHTSTLQCEGSFPALDGETPHGISKVNLAKPTGCTDSKGRCGCVGRRALVTRALRKRSIPHSQPCASCGSLYASSMLGVTPVFWNLRTAVMCQHHTSSMLGFAPVFWHLRTAGMSQHHAAPPDHH